MTEAAAPLRVDALDQAALAYARKWRLITDNGEVLCLRLDQGCDQPATFPTLLCRKHLAARQRGYR